MLPFSPEDQLESVISGMAIHRFNSLADFLDAIAREEITPSEIGAKIILHGIYELVQRDLRWYLRRFKSVHSNLEIEVAHDELVVGEEREYCQVIWDPQIAVQKKEPPHTLLDYTSKAKKKQLSSQNVMEAMTFL